MHFLNLFSSLKKSEHTHQRSGENTPHHETAEHREHHSHSEHGGHRYQKKRNYVLRFRGDKRLTFAGKLLIYAAVWILVISACCAVMWNMMVQYEKAQPQYAMENLLSSDLQSMFYRAMLHVDESDENPFESPYEAAGKLASAYRGKLSYTKLIREYTYENPVYLLSCDDDPILRITLMQTGTTGFLGLRGYGLYSVEPLSNEIFAPKTLSLIVPNGAAVSINDKAAGDPYIVSQNSFAPFGDDAPFTMYRAENFFAQPKVEVVADGVTLLGSGEWNQLYDYPEPKLHTAVITAPEGAVVSVNEQTVDSLFISSTADTEPDIFGYTAKLCIYTVNTVFGDCEIAVQKDGVPLENIGKENPFFAAPTLNCTVTVPKGGVLYANGAPVPKDFLTDTEALWKSDFDGVRNAPSAYEYTLSGIYQIPALTATENRTELRAVDDGDGRVAFIAAADDTLQAEYTEQVMTFAKTYLQYITQGYNNTQANLNSTLALVLYPSPLYTNLSRSQIGYMYIAPQKMTIDTLLAKDFIPYGDSAFTCTVSYSITLSNFVGTTVQEGEFLLAFVKSGDGYLPANMILR